MKHCFDRQQHENQSVEMSERGQGMQLFLGQLFLQARYVAKNLI